MNGQPRINTIHCLIVMDADNTEGVPAFAGAKHMEGGTLQEGTCVYPAYFIDPKMVPHARELARKTARETGRPVVLARFTERRDIEEFKP